MNRRAIALATCCIALMACSRTPADAPPAPSSVDDGGAEESGADTNAPPVDAAPACAPPAVTCDGACVLGGCDFAVTSITPVAPSGSSGGASDWVSGGAFFTVRGHGFAKGMKVFLGDGRAPVRVLDDRTATVQAPPSRAGIVDVTIDLGGKKATTQRAFEYKTATIEGTLPWEKRTMSTPHADMPSIGTIADGRALVTGGLSSISPLEMTAKADIFSLDAQNAAPTATPMHTARWNHQTVPLLDGRAVILGASGVGAAACCDSMIVDLFDPATNAFVTSKGAPTEAFQGPRGVLLADGRVLVLSYGTSSAQIFDPDAETFTAVAGAPTIDYWQTTGLGYLARLRDGRVLVVTGQGRDGFTFDPDTGTFARAGKGPAAAPDAVFTLPDGRVAAVGGAITSGTTSTPSNAVELFDPAAGTGFARAPYSLTAPRIASATALARDGSLIVIGGATGALPNRYACGTAVSTENATTAVDRVDPIAGTVEAFAPLPEPNDFLVAATLLDGSVVAAGGGVCGASQPYPYLYFRKAPPLR